MEVFISTAAWMDRRRDRHTVAHAEWAMMSSTLLAYQSAWIHFVHAIAAEHGCYGSLSEASDEFVDLPGTHVNEKKFTNIKDALNMTNFVSALPPPQKNGRACAREKKHTHL